ncbi:MAG TPA: zinc-binding dehydrogenase [Acidimicrobiales bacterium]|nr:zinc-binding dehydrogenase [Acidimicrobiales bacterium]
MKALVFERNMGRFAAARVASSLAGSGKGVGVGPMRLKEIDELDLPGHGWVRVKPRLAGICGSDLSTIDATSSRYFEQIVSFPFVPGHEIVGDAVGGELDGKRVVVEPVLGCAARAIDPPCPACASGSKGRCERIAFGHLKPGLQTGYCNETGGGWSAGLVAHTSQLHVVPEALSDEAAVMVEPTACAIHAALSPGLGLLDGANVVVLGAGTLGLGVVAALRHFALPATILAIAKHPDQTRLARELGADVVAKPTEIRRAVRRVTGALAISHTGSAGRIERLAGGADVVFDCVGSSESIDECLSVVRPGGRIVMVGMPGTVRVDLAPLWQREVIMSGAYAYGTEALPTGARSTFDLAFELVGAARLERLVSGWYPLECYADALEHAATAGRRGAVKIVFDLRRPAPRPTAPETKQRVSGSKRGRSMSRAGRGTRTAASGPRPGATPTQAPTDGSMEGSEL